MMNELINYIPVGLQTSPDRDSMRSSLMRLVTEQDDPRHVIVLNSSSTHRDAIPNLIERIVLVPRRKNSDIPERPIDIRLDPRTGPKSCRKTRVPDIKLIPYCPLLQQRLLRLANVSWHVIERVLRAITRRDRVEAFAYCDVVAKARGEPYQCIGDHVFFHDTMFG